MSENQLNLMATDPPDTMVLRGHDNLQRVVETTEMHWLGAEGVVTFPEGVCDGLLE